MIAGFSAYLPSFYPALKPEHLENALRETTSPFLPEASPQGRQVEGSTGTEPGGPGIRVTGEESGATKP